MNAIDKEIEFIEISAVTAKRSVSLLQSLERLERNRDFRALFTTNYVTLEPARLVGLLDHPAQSSDADQASLQKEMISISVFMQYLVTIRRQGEAAAAALKTQEADLESLRAIDNPEDYEEEV